MATNRQCSKCFGAYVLTPDKPGLIHHCPECSRETTERLGGNMVYSHKTAPEIEIKSISDAKVFAKKQRRFGAGVTQCLTVGRETAHNQMNHINPREENS